MKFALAALIVSGFVATAVFGILAINHSDHIEHDCFAATTKGQLCPNESSLEFLTFHFQVFRELSTSTLNVFALAASLLLAAALLVRLGISGSKLLPLLPKGIYQNRHAGPFVPAYKTKLSNWLAFHENSPSNI